ncbi:MAG: adenylosuccinate synthase [Alphaproteobacteria bacterium]|nr:adenylosuccinate synthase [Alphaproteobacteria bacterium]
MGSEKLPRNVIITGLQWGDEGKGKVVDLLARKSQHVVRFQGGNNAGHTLVVAGQQSILHVVPSGILHPGTTCVVGNGVVVDPEVLCQELRALEAKGVDLSGDRLIISEQAHVILPYHRTLDDCRETALGGKKIGTTKKGIGPTYEDKVARRGVRVGDLLDEDALRNRLLAVLPEKNRILTEWYGDAAHTVEELLAWARPLAERLRPHVRDTVAWLHRANRAGDRILFEGAQGTFLDVDHGTYPFVTSSNTVAGQACAGTGVGPTDIHAIVGIAKAYTTRVGAGPFPTELDDDLGARIREIGHEYGATTGRPRRCGWFDAALVRHAVQLNGTTHVALTKLDVLSGLESLLIAHAYDGLDSVPSGAEALAAVRPVYEEVPGWTEDITGCRSYDELPAACRAYVERIETLIGVPVGLVSVGPGRDEVIPRSPLFADD